MSLKILLADDSPHAQRDGSRILAELGYQVATVSNGSAALKRFEEDPPDLLIADTSMPGLTGLEICARVKQQPEWSSTPVLLALAAFELYDAEQGRQAGADGVIQKPFIPSALERMVEELLAKAGKPLGPAAPSGEGAPAPELPEAPAETAAEAPAEAQPKIELEVKSEAAPGAAAESADARPRWRIEEIAISAPAAEAAPPVAPEPPGPEPASAVKEKQESSFVGQDASSAPAAESSAAAVTPAAAAAAAGAAVSSWIVAPPTRAPEGERGASASLAADEPSHWSAAFEFHHAEPRIEPESPARPATRPPLAEDNDQLPAHLDPAVAAILQHPGPTANAAKPEPDAAAGAPEPVAMVAAAAPALTATPAPSELGAAATAPPPSGGDDWLLDALREAIQPPAAPAAPPVPKVELETALAAMEEVLAQYLAPMLADEVKDQIARRLRALE